MRKWVKGRCMCETCELFRAGRTSEDDAFTAEEGYIVGRRWEKMPRKKRNKSFLTTLKVLYKRFKKWLKSDIRFTIKLK